MSSVGQVDLHGMTEINTTRFRGQPYRLVSNRSISIIRDKAFPLGGQILVVNNGAELAYDGG